MSANLTMPSEKNLLPALDTAGLFGHPRGITTLFFTELWERFSYYGMRAILVLYMVAPVSAGGLAFDVSKAAMIYGLYTMLVYMMSIPGGFISDRFLGARRSVLIGGIVIMIGHFTLALASVTTFFIGLILIILGTGLLKPNISTMLGSLYKPDDIRRDAGFSIFYMGINIGAALAPLICGFLAQSKIFREFLHVQGLEPQSSWHWGFAAAGIGMLLGLIQYICQRKRLAHVGNRPKKKIDLSSDKNEPLTITEWKRIGAIGVLFFFTILFWAIYEQGGSSLNLFADKLTRNEAFGFEYPSSWYQSLQAIYVILLAPLYAYLWVRLGDKQPSSPTKFALGLLLLGLGIAVMVPASLLAAQGKVSPFWLFAVYFLQVAGELCLSPVGLSTVTKLAPARLLGLMMGVWFLAASFGNLLAGLLAGFFKEDNINILVTMFGSMGAAAIIAAIILLLLRPFVCKLMSGVR
jgi:POT family proton-dependent oligopeptide transporter